MDVLAECWQPLSFRLSSAQFDASQQVVTNMKARSLDKVMMQPGAMITLKYYERVGMTEAADVDLNRRLHSDPVSVEDFQDLM